MGVKLSVIIPVYNAEQTIARAIDSVLKQDFDNYQIIAVDDGSNDSSPRVLRGYGDRIKVARQCNRGAAAARNAGARIAEGEYLAFLDADDEWLPERLTVSVRALEESPAAVVAYSDMIRDDGGAISPMQGSPSLDYLLSGRFALFPSAVTVRRSAFARSGGFPEQFSGAGFEDMYTALLLREQGEFVHIAKPLVVYHISEASTLISKYRPGYRVFRRLVKQRYGYRAHGLLTVARRYYASLTFGAGVEAWQKGNLVLAGIRLWRASMVSPIYIVRRTCAGVASGWKPTGNT
jgi:glycosyltransferase involved in cell wall biosynthesis